MQHYLFIWIQWQRQNAKEEEKKHTKKPLNTVCQKIIHQTDNTCGAKYLAPSYFNYLFVFELGDNGCVVWNWNKNIHTMTNCCQTQFSSDVYYLFQWNESSINLMYLCELWIVNCVNALNWTISFSNWNRYVSYMYQHQHIWLIDVKHIKCA